MGFTMHFYIIFGTNLLTKGPVQIAVFLPISVIPRKGISNGVQTEWNLRGVIFGTNVIQRTWSGRQEINKEATRQGGAPAPLGAPPTLVGPSQLHQPTSFAYIYSYTLKTSREPRNHFSTAATFCTRGIPSWGLFRRSAGGGFDHGGLLHQHHSLSDDVWVVYHRPSGP